MQKQIYLNHILKKKRFKAGQSTIWKPSKYGVFSGPYFPVFGLNMEIYGVNLRIQSEYGKIRSRKNSALGHFSRSEEDRFARFNTLAMPDKPLTSWRSH